MEDAARAALRSHRGARVRGLGGLLGEEGEWIMASMGFKVAVALVGVVAVAGLAVWVGEGGLRPAGPSTADEAAYAAAGEVQAAQDAETDARYLALLHEVVPPVEGGVEDRWLIEMGQILCQGLFDGDSVSELVYGGDFGGPEVMGGYLRAATSTYCTEHLEAWNAFVATSQANG